MIATLLNKQDAKMEHELSVREAGKKGGNSTLQKYGKDYFKKIASKPRKRNKKLSTDKGLQV